MQVFYERPSAIRPYTIVIISPFTYHQYIELLDIVDDYVSVYPKHISFYVPFNASCIDDLLGYVPFSFYEYLKREVSDESGFMEDSNLLDDNTVRLQTDCPLPIHIP